MKTHYMVVGAETISSLEKSVDVYLDEGWELQGGVAAIPNNSPSGYLFVQAMTLKE